MRLVLSQQDNVSSLKEEPRTALVAFLRSRPALATVELRFVGKPCRAVSKLFFFDKGKCSSRAKFFSGSYWPWLRDRASPPLILVLMLGPVLIVAARELQPTGFVRQTAPGILGWHCDLCVVVFNKGTLLPCACECARACLVSR